MDAMTLRRLITRGLVCEHLDIQGDGRHWFATIVSSDFEGKRLIQRHQQVYATLGNSLETDAVHALSMRTYTPQEWEEQGRPQIM